MFVCFAGAASLIFLFRNQIFADQLRGDVTFRQSIKTDLNNDGAEETVTITVYRKDNKISNILTVEKSFVHPSSKSLSGFENDIKFCQQPIYKFSNGDSLVCLVGDVGVHSQNIQFSGYKNGQIIFALFKNGNESSESVISDEPNFTIANGNPPLLLVDNRNYDLDPVSDAVRSKYEYSNGVFTFLTSKDIVYDVAQ